MLRSVLNAVFPVKCFSCGHDVAGGGYHLVCSDCADGAIQPDTGGKKCLVCGKTIGDGKSEICYRCSVTSYHFKKNTSILNYREPVVRELTHQFKFGSNRLAGQDLAKMLKEKLRSEVAVSGCDITTATPLSGPARKKRGFNQVEEILDWCGINHVSLLKRTGHTRHQSELGSEDRMVSIKGQFSLDQKSFNYIQGKKILVVDDVYTTGSTANEISGVLMEAGADSVEVLTYFRD